MPVFRTMLWMELMRISLKNTLKTVIKAKCLMSYTRMQIMKRYEFEPWLTRRWMMKDVMHLAV